MKRTSSQITPAARQVLYPWIRVELLIRRSPAGAWDAETWPVMREQLRCSYALRELARRARVCN